MERVRPLPPVEQQSQTESRSVIPYTIRGHHISFYVELIKGTTTNSQPTSPVEIASDQAAFYLKSWQRVKSLENFKQNPEYLYWKDMIGTNQKQRRQVQEGQKLAFELFLDLPEDYPVELVSGKKDVLCSTCITGEHCTVSGPKFGTEASTRLNRDASVVFNFITAAEDQGFVDDLIITTKPTDFTDMDTKYAIAVKTTAKIFKDVIKHSDRFSVLGE